MALRIPYGLDPDETWEIDFVKESAERTIERLAAAVEGQKAAAEAERDEKKKEALLAAVKAGEAARAKLEEELRAYVPGSGPMFTLAPLPNAKRAELFGESLEVGAMDAPKEREVRDTAWSEEVVRWSVRGHRNHRSGKTGKEIPFKLEEVPFAGGKRAVVARATLESYGRFLGELALVVLRSQRLDEAGKNA